MSLWPFSGHLTQLIFHRLKVVTQYYSGVGHTHTHTHILALTLHLVWESIIALKKVLSIII